MPNFSVQALYDYSSPHEDDLSFATGQIITVTEEEDADWYIGEYVDSNGTKHDGLFPRNFVKKYEPEPPPRPNRASRIKPLEQPVAPADPPVPDVPQQEAAPPPQPEPEVLKPQPPPVQVPPPASQNSPLSPQSAQSTKSAEIPHEAPAAPEEARVKPASPAPAKKPPPPVAAKSNALSSRINMFNQSVSPPPQPFKQQVSKPSFIKKPFVAPPPSKNAYVPVFREAPAIKTYRREEDPEIAERVAQNQENAERAGLTSHGAAPGKEEQVEDQPKVTLKERIALLQKQQQEQAARAAAAQKEKPKRPPVKKRTESHERGVEEAEGASLEKVVSEEPRERGSTDSTRPPRPAHPPKIPELHANRELLSDANDADQSGAGETEDAEGTSTSVDDDDERTKHRAPARAPAAPVREPDVGDEQNVEEEEEEDEMDAEARRKLELRQRMANLGGFNPFQMGAPMGLPPKKKPPPPVAKKSIDSGEYSVSQQRVPMFGVPPIRSPENEDKQLQVEKEDESYHPITDSHSAEEVPDVEEVALKSIERTPTAEHPPPVPSERRPLPPPIPTGERPAPPPVPSASRPIPPPPPIRSPSPGSESGDEVSDTTHPEAPISPRTPSALPQRSSYLASDEMSESSPDKRAMPPIPLGSPPFSPTLANRPPPPPPPTAAAPSRQPTMDSIVKKVDREGETDYEGDYDTDIAPGATHKDALKSHVREQSIDDSTTADETPVRSPVAPPVPHFPLSFPRAVPPPPPHQPPNRVSMDTPRAAPPLPPVIPPAHDFEGDDEEYDPYKYNASSSRGVPPVPRAAPQPTGRPPPPAMPPSVPPVPQHQAAESSDEDELYASPPPRKSHDRPPPPPPAMPPHLRHAPPPPPGLSAPLAPPTESSQPRPPIGRKSLDVNRSTQGRGSADQPRSSASRDFIASDLDLGPATHWWTQPKMAPPSVQSLKDILYELDESKSGNSIEKAVFVLYMDYSQTTITARFQTNDASKVQLEQRHDPPPGRLRQDQLETAHERFGSRIAKDVESKQNMIVGNGTPQGLVDELLRPYKDALKPVSTRAFGALVYANLANASTQQYDQIRPGDIISFRNARFQGKHGTMHAKYSTEVGRPDHVGVVVEWDGRKKKVRVWEQGRESRKVKPESFKMEDLRSGEVRVWRVMGRSWVGWS